MRVLVDTHVLLWSMLETTRLTPRVRAVLDDDASESFVSAGTAWEIATKVWIGKLDEARPVVDRYQDHLALLGMRSLDVTTDHALLAGSLEWELRDPFDRMIAAQAISEQLVLVTADRAFRGIPALATLW